MGKFKFHLKNNQLQKYVDGRIMIFWKKVYPPGYITDKKFCLTLLQMKMKNSLSSVIIQFTEHPTNDIFCFCQICTYTIYREIC